MTASARRAWSIIRGSLLAASIILSWSVSLTEAANPLATPTPVLTHPPAQASLQVSPTHGQATTQVGVLGQGFAANAVLTMALDNADGTLNSITTDRAGHFTSGVTLPSGTSSGTHQLLAYSGTDEVAAVLYTVDAAPPPCRGFVISLPVLGDACIDIGQLVNQLLAATFGSIANMLGGAWDAVTGPFAPALTNTPNFAADRTWSAFQTFMTTLQYMWGTVFVAMFVFGMFARYLESIGAGSFQGILGIMGRAMLLTAFLALYNPIMANWVFPAENGLATAITDASILGGSGGFDAIGKALATVSSVLSFTSIVDLLILIIALVVAVLCVIVRDMGLGVLATLYIIGPLALISWLSPQFDFIARWWLRTMVNLLLWPVGYALALQVGSALLAASGWTGLLGSLGALGCLVLLYRVPDIIGSMAGSQSVAGVATLVTDRGAQWATMVAQRLVKRT